MQNNDCQKLRRCPFCGSTDVYTDWWYPLNEDKQEFVKCCECGAMSGMFDRVSKAIEAWNRRCC